MPNIMGEVSFMGHATRDMRTSLTTSGTPMATFSIAINDKSKEKKTAFFSVVVFGKQVEWINVQKGDLVLLYGGTLSVDEYNGQKSFAIFGPNVFNASEYARQKGQELIHPVEIPEGDVPF